MAVTAADMDIRFGVSGADKAESAMRSLGGGFDNLARKGGAAGGFLKNALSFATGDLISRGMQKVSQAISDGVNEVIDFGGNMANVNSIMKLSDDGLRALEDQVLSLDNNPAITAGPAELAAGLYDIASSGFQGAAGLQVLTAAAIAASAGLTTTATAAQGIDAILNAYGLSAASATDVSDKMFQTVNDGVLTFEQLANNMGQTLKPAQQLGLSIDELLAGYAQLTLNGMNASASETAMANIIKASMNPTTALTAALGDYGTAQAAIADLGFDGYLKLIMDAADGNSSALFDMLGSQEAVNAALILGTGNAADYTAEIDRMANSEGATQAAVEKQMKSARFQLGQVRKELMLFATEMMISFEPSIAGGARKVAGFIGDGLIPMTKWLTAVISGNDDLISTTAAGGTYWSKQDMLMSKIPPQLRGTAMAMATVTQASIGMAKGLIESFEAGKTVDELVKNLPTSIQGAASAIFTFSDDIGDMLRQIEQGDWSGLWDEFKQTMSHGVELGDIALEATFHLVSNIIGSVWDWLKGAILGTHTVVEGPGLGAHTEANGGLVDIGEVALTALFNLAKDVFGASVDLAGWIADQLEVGWNGIVELSDATLSLGNVVIEEIQNGVLLTDVSIAIQNALRGHGIEISDWKISFLFGDGNMSIDLAGIGGAMVSAIKALPSLGSDVAGAIWDAIVSVDWVSLSTSQSFGAGEGLGTAVHNLIVAGIHAMGDITLDDIVSVFEAFAKSAAANALAAPAAITLMATALISFIGGAIKGLVFGDSDIDFTDVWQFISDGITAAFDDVGDMFGDLSTAVGTAIGTALDNAEAAIIASIPGWMIKMANGDYLGAVKDMFGGGSGGGSTIGGMGGGFSPTTPPPNDPYGVYSWDGHQWVRTGRSNTPINPDVASPVSFGDFSGGQGDTSGGLAAAGKAAVDSVANFDASRAALDLLADSFTKAHEPVDLFSGQIDAAMSRMQQSITTHAIQSGNSLNTALGSSMAQAAAISEQGAVSVDQAMAWLPGAMFNTGANASHAFAQGLWSGVGEAQAAADAIAAAADEAMRSRLQINSPSKVFANHADMVVEGFVGTLRSRSGEVSDAFGSTFAPDFNRGSSSAYRPASTGGNKVTIISVHSSEIEKIAEMARAGHDLADGFPREFDMLRAGGFG